MSRRIAQIIVVSMLYFAGSGVSGVERCAIGIVNANSKVVPLSVEIANTDRSRAAGLMHRTSLSKNAGMLFVFPDSSHRSFWMKNTLIPLTIAYIDRNGYIRELYDMKPLDTSVTYPSRSPSRFALEVNRGWFREHNITAGCRVLFHGCVGQ